MSIKSLRLPRPSMALIFMAAMSLDDAKSILWDSRCAEKVKVHRLPMTILQSQRRATHKAHPLHLGLRREHLQEFQGVGKDCLKV